jgi:hypothetical protein
MTNARSWLVAMGLFTSGLGACTPGYIRASELERKEQGPSACAARCQELHMRMGALVLVGDQLPGCVCQPVEHKTDAADEGASAATTSYAVVLAAAAAAQNLRQQQQAQQQTAVGAAH